MPPIDKAGEGYGRDWIIIACRPPARGELIYLASYDRIIAATENGLQCAVIVQLVSK